jgi:hypothetical protein
MIDKDDIRILDQQTDEDGRTFGMAAVRAPMAVPFMRGTRAVVASAIMAAAIAAPFFAPALAFQIAIGNGVMAFLFFMAYKASSSAAARYFNEATILGIIQSENFSAQLTEIIEESEGNLSSPELSNEGEAETEADAEPK